MLDQVTKARLHPSLARPGLLHWSHEVAEVDSSHHRVRHDLSVPLDEGPAAPRFREKASMLTYVIVAAVAVRGSSCGNLRGLSVSASLLLSSLQ